MADEATDDRGESVAEIKQPEDEYSSAWDEAQGIGEKADQKEEAAEPEKEDTPKEPEAKEPEVKTEQPPPPEDEKYEQRYKTLQGIHKHDKESWESEKAQLLTQIEEAKKPKEPTPEQKKATTEFVDSLTDEQKKQLDEYEADFDVVSKMEGLKRGRELAKLRKEFQDWKDEIVSKLTEQETKIAPVFEKVAKNETERHFNTIKSEHPDFETYRDDGSLQAWIKTKPKYMQPALMSTYSQGTADDVIEMISDFKRENNINIQPPVNTEKAKKKQALSVVTSRRGAVNAAHSVAADYESAWEEANAKLGG